MHLSNGKIVALTVIMLTALGFNNDLFFLGEDGSFNNTTAIVVLASFVPVVGFWSTKRVKAWYWRLVAELATSRVAIQFSSEEVAGERHRSLHIKARAAERRANAPRHA